MGLLDKRNINKAKRLLDKNKHKVGGMVDKATDQVDKVTKGKSASLTAKIDKAAHKFSGDEVDEAKPDEPVNPEAEADTTA
jgi:hypothetical protein